MKFFALTLIAAVFAGSTAFASESVDERPVKRYRPAPQVQQQPNDDYQGYDDYQNDGYTEGGYVQGGYVQQGCCGRALPPPIMPINPPIYPQPVYREICTVIVNPHNWGIQSNLRGIIASGSNWQRGRITYMRQMLMAQGCVFTN